MRTPRLVIGCVAVALLVASVGLLFSGPIATFLSNQFAIPNVPPIVRTATARVKTGASRDEVLVAFSDAWFHGDCRFSDGTGYDVFLYGEHSRDKVDVLIIRYANLNGTARVDFIGYEESYRLKLYERCIPEGVFQLPN